MKIRPSQFALAAMAAITACSEPPEHRDTRGDILPPRPNEVTFVATEYAFGGPAWIPAGLTTLRMVNRGAEVHWMEMFKVADGKTVADLLAVLESGQQLPSWQQFPTWMTVAGGPGWICHGEASNQTAYLEPGHYVLICRFPTADGVPHLDMGMVSELDVTTASTPAAVEPQADIVIAISDSAFHLSVPIPAGRHTIRVNNVGSYRHELYILRLAPGKSIEDYWAWERGGLTESGRPGQPWGGVTPFEPETHVWFTATFEPGEYVFGDESWAGPHIFRQVTVR